MDVQALAKEARRQPVVGPQPCHLTPVGLQKKWSKARDHLKLLNSSPAGKQKAPEPCFCNTGKPGNAR